MTTDSEVNVSQFIVAFMDGAHGTITRAVDGLTDEQMRFRPSEDTNSIVWLIWHLYRWQDRQSASVAGEEELWISGGWAERFGMTPDDTGFGDTAEQVVAFQPERDLLMGYAGAVHQAFAERLGSVTQADLNRPMESASGRGDPQPAWRSLMGICMDTMQHAGQIAYLRGLHTGIGWFF